MYHCAKFRADWSNCCGDMVIFRFFKMAAVRHLRFLKVVIFTHPANVRHYTKFRAGPWNRCRDMAVFRFIRMAAVYRLGFIKVPNFNCRSYSEGQYVLPHATFHADQPSYCGDMAIFHFLRWRPSAILYLFYACLDHQRSVVGSRCAKFGWNRHCTFEDVRFLTFCTLRLKMPIHAPFWGKMGENGHFLQFYLSGNTITWDWRPMNQTAWKSLLRFSLGTRAKIWFTKKTKNHTRVIFNPFAGTLPLGRSLWILACGVISPT